MPQLKSFLKDGEAESYRNVEVKFIHGRKAIMTIWEAGYDNGGVDGDRERWEEVEKITLSDYKTKVEMHALFIEKGFQMKSEEELAAWKIQKEKEAEEERERKQKQREQNLKMQEERRRKREMEKEEDMRRQEEMWKEKEQEEQVRRENEILEDEPAVPLDEPAVSSDPVEEFQDEL
eukprot:CAMPEP_0172538236 /NCGR_PEP_ID=MMETSP1067-20121228/9667_1 /TAXON_ID=265564 ORGANISM="Thalassiosira punctigera, Strain Tpunct2005C2" /NCGR_SAMPLE_ID=MMETSP1067 /ASSEMBLY_ACC=CAM_ASM_000444 /LENGTH=176 /DNA_ID=CAMNT_0013323691 /DNA_START=152 /DNA_END=682 /DNA_ORIENTATION=+